jgi:hypothetical protein
MGNMINFDEYIAERKKKSPQFTLFEKEYILPPSIPYRAVVYLQSLNKRNADDQINDEDILHFFALLLGKDAIATWQDNVNFDIDLIVHVMGWIVNQYGLTPKVATEKKEQVEE